VKLHERLILVNQSFNTPELEGENFYAFLQKYMDRITAGEVYDAFDSHGDFGSAMVEFGSSRYFMKDAEQIVPINNAIFNFKVRSNRFTSTWFTPTGTNHKNQLLTILHEGIISKDYSCVIEFGKSISPLLETVQTLWDDERIEPGYYSIRGSFAIILDLREYLNKVSLKAGLDTNSFWRQLVFLRFFNGTSDDTRIVKIINETDNMRVLNFVLENNIPLKDVNSYVNAPKEWLTALS